MGNIEIENNDNANLFDTDFDFEEDILNVIMARVNNIDSQLQTFHDSMDRYYFKNTAVFFQGS